MLRGTQQAAGQWRRRLREGGRDALLSLGMGGRSYLSAERVAELDGLLKQGLAVHGWDDQRRALARVGRVIEERFGVVYEISGMWRMLDRLGRSRSAGPSSATRRRSPFGARRHGRRSPIRDPCTGQKERAWAG